MSGHKHNWISLGERDFDMEEIPCEKCKKPSMIHKITRLSETHSWRPHRYFNFRNKFQCPDCGEVKWVLEKKERKEDGR